MPCIWNVSYTHALPSPEVVAAVLSAAAGLEGLCSGIAGRDVRIERSEADRSGTRVRLSFEAAGRSFLVHRWTPGEPGDAELRDLVRQTFEGGRRLLRKHLGRVGLRAAA